jgi:hypothetical protein
MCNNMMKRIVLGPTKKRKKAAAARRRARASAEAVDSSSDSESDDDGIQDVVGEEPRIDIGDDGAAFDADHVGMAGMLLLGCWAPPCTWR